MNPVRTTTLAATWQTLFTATETLSLAYRVLNTQAQSNKVSLAIAPSTYLPGAVPGNAAMVEYGVAMPSGGILDGDQIIMQKGESLVTWGDSALTAHVHPMTIPDWQGVVWGGISPAVGTYKNLGTATQLCQMKVQFCNLSAVAVVASLVICAPGHADLTPPGANDFYFGRDVVIPPSGTAMGGVWHESAIVLATGETLVAYVGGQVAVRAHGINLPS